MIVVVGGSLAAEFPRWVERTNGVWPSKRIQIGSENFYSTTITTRSVKRQGWDARPAHTRWTDYSRWEVFASFRWGQTPLSVSAVFNLKWALGVTRNKKRWFGAQAQKCYLVCPHQHHHHQPAKFLKWLFLIFSAQIRPFLEFLVPVFFMYVPRVKTQRWRCTGQPQPKSIDCMCHVPLLWGYSRELPYQQQCAQQCRPGWRRWSHILLYAAMSN